MGMMRGAAIGSVISSTVGNIGNMSRGKGAPAPTVGTGEGTPLPTGAPRQGMPMPTGGSGGAGGAVETVGSAIGMTGQVAGTVVGLNWQKNALAQGFNKHMNNFKEYQTAIGDSRSKYLQDSYKVSDDYADAMKGATRDYTRQAAGAINSGAQFKEIGSTVTPKCN